MIFARYGAERARLERLVEEIGRLVEEFEGLVGGGRREFFEFPLLSRGWEAEVQEAGVKVRSLVARLSYVLWPEELYEPEPEEYRGVG